MSIYDILMLAVFLGAIVFGAWKGLAWQIASFAAVVVSYLVALNFSSMLADLLQVPPPWNRLTAMLILFLGTSLAIWLVYGRIKDSIKRLNLGGFDRQAGATLGAVKGALLCMVITMFGVSLFGERAAEAICHSRTGGYIVTGIDHVTTIVPDEIHEIVHPYVEEFQKKIAHDGHSHPDGKVHQQSTVYGNPDDARVTPPAANNNVYEVRGTLDPEQPNQSYRTFTGQWEQPQNNGGGIQEELGGILGNVLDHVFDAAKERLKNGGQDTANRFLNGNQNR